MLRNGWLRTTIGEQIMLQRGFDITRADQRSGHVPVVSSGGVSSFHDIPAVKGPGVVLGRKGVVGSVYYIEDDFWPHDTTLWVKEFRGNNPRFVYYFFKSLVTTLAGLDVGSANPTLNRNHVHPIKAYWPSEPEQQAIAAVLSSLDDKMEQNRRTNRALEGLARAIFKAWFVDFEPVKAKAADAAGFPGMPPSAFAALPDRLTESQFGFVPEGWEFGKLADYCNINARRVRTGEIDGEIGYIDIASVTVGRLDGVQRIAFAEAPSRARRRVRHGDTIWSCVRPNRRSYLFIHSPSENWIASTGFAVLSPATFGASYLHELTTRQEFVDYLVANADGSAYPAVRPEHFAVAPVLAPPANVRDAFEEVTMPLRDLLAANERESATLAALRDYLLPRLLSGQVRVGDLGATPELDAS